LQSTYGGRRTDAVQDMRLKLAEIVRRTMEREGRVLIPAFSVGRTQTILYDLRRLFDSGELKSVPVYVDSPLAIDATEIFRLHPECFDDQAAAMADDPYRFLHGPEFHFVQTREESKVVMRSGHPCIVIAASGMCEAGRILHHLRSGADDARNTILIAGYQAAHTLGRRIVERQSEVPILGDRIALRAEVAVLNGYSSHADSEELRQYAEPARGRCRKIFLVHGEQNNPPWPPLSNPPATRISIPAPVTVSASAG
jgi:metallo-beta-lactamase family protein